MRKSSAEINLEQRAELFKALGHPVRLNILNLIRIKPRHGEELASILGLNPATISHHLNKLVNVGLLKAQKDQYYQIYSLIKDLLDTSLSEMIQVPQNGLSTQVQTDAYRDKVIKTFFRRGRLGKIPAQLKKRQIVLEKIVEEFEPEHEYTEKEVNLILLDFNDDIAALRRGLIEHKLIQRDHGIYWRTNQDGE